MQVKTKKQLKKMLFSGDLAQRIGDAKVSSSSLRDYFVVDKIKLWEIIEPTLAAFEIPRILDADSFFFKRLEYILRSNFAQIKYRNIRRRELKLTRRKINNHIKINERVDIFLFGYSGYMERDVLSPLIHHIRDAKLSYHTISDNDTLSTANKNNNLEDRLNIWSLWNQDCEKELNRISEDYRCLLDALDDKTVRSIYDICKAPCSLTIFRAFIRYVFHSLLPHYFHHIVIAERLFEHSQVKWNISPDVSDPRIRAFCLVGRKYKVKWADIQFGIYSIDAVEWRFCQSDAVCVWGENNRALLNDFGIPNSIIHVTGSPKFDSLVRIKSSTCRKKHEKDKLINVLFCSMYALKAYSNIPNYEETLKIVKSDVIKFARKNSRVKLTIKLHPLENDGIVKDLASEDGNIEVVSGDIDIRDYIKECDVFITIGSTATIDAILLEKPVIFPNYDGLVWWDDIYLKSAVTIEAPTSTHLENLMQTLDTLLQNNESDEISRNRKAFIKEWVSFPEEESSKIVLRTIGLI